MTHISDYDYHLPEELIAQNPLKNRENSKMMVIDHKTGELTVTTFNHIVDYISPNDCLVFNDTKVIPARVFGKKILSDGSEGATIEALLIEEISLQKWVAMVRPGRRVKAGTIIKLSDRENDYFVIDQKHKDGTCTIKFPEVEVYELLDRVGHIPLPPYIKREDTKADREQYQTIFADKPGAVAAPTAGLHFTKNILTQLKKQGTQTCSVTLHVGPGTFKPVQVEDITAHKMHTEQYALSAPTASTINQVKANGGRIFAVGTTSVRVMESSAQENKALAGHGKTDIFIYPPYQPKVVDCLLTNFHLPKSTLLMLVSAFAGRDHIMKAYEKAITEEFRFFSYGDCMLIV
jgi:S-adenosylmethionine:tRNA ribosyltransferase-isomerase